MITDGKIVINTATFALPCKRFSIHCSVTSEERLPVVTEFSVRLIGICASLHVSQLQSFLGLNSKETEILVQTLIGQRLAQWVNDDTLELTPYTKSRIEESSDGLPRFFRIEDWNARADFDLISYNLVSDYDSERPQKLIGSIELPVPEEKLSSSIIQAEAAFIRNFGEYQSNRKAAKSPKERYDIYKVSSVEARNSYSIPIETQFILEYENDLEINRDFESYEDSKRESRAAIIETISDTLSTMADNPDVSSMEEFIGIFSVDILRRYFNGVKFDLRDYIRDFHEKKILEHDELTIPIIGNIYTKDNIQTLCEYLSFCKDPDEQKTPPSVYWLTPHVKLWGRTPKIMDVERSICEIIAKKKKKEGKTESACKALMLSTSKDDDWKIINLYSKALSSISVYKDLLLDGKLEVLLHPSHMVCALYHHYIPGKPTVSVPIGFISTDQAKIDAARELIYRHMVTHDSYRGMLVPKTHPSAQPKFEEAFPFLIKK